MISLCKLRRIACLRPNAWVTRVMREHDRAAPLLLALLMLPLAGCAGNLASSDDPNLWYNKTIAENITGRSADESVPAYASAAPTGPVAAVAATAANMPVQTNEFYRSDGSCGGIMLGGARPASRGGSAAAAAINLDMTECEVARLAGPPDKIEFSTNERGERIFVMTYAHSERPRIYRFAAGRLISIEAPAARSVLQRQPSRAQ
jgi:hypothetical protein